MIDTAHIQDTARARGAERLAYIAGTSYCGSTLLAIVLNAHPEIVSIGEMGPAARWEREGYRCSCGESFADCAFFSAVTRRMSAAGLAFDPARMRLRHTYVGRRVLNRLAFKYALNPVVDGLRDAVRDVLPGVGSRLADCRRRNQGFVRAALEVSGKSVFLDATKNADRIPFLLGTDLDVSVIHLVRDPRGYCHSAHRHDATSPERAAAEWVRGHDEIEYHLRHVAPDRQLRVRYESICADADGTLSRITEFLGAGPMREPESFRDQPYHVIGNAMRKRNDGRTRIALDERWREGLSRDDLRAIGRVTGKTALRYGYNLDE